MDFRSSAEYAGGCIAGGHATCTSTPTATWTPACSSLFKLQHPGEEPAECLQSPLFMAYHDNQPFNENMYHPCPMLEARSSLRKMVLRTGASTILSLPRAYRIDVRPHPMPATGLHSTTSCGRSHRLRQVRRLLAAPGCGGNNGHKKRVYMVFVRALAVRKSFRQAGDFFET